MGLTPTADFGRIVRERAKQVAQKAERAILQTLSYLGEQCVSHARQNHTYRDQTGNLTASIGYAIAHKGEIKRVNFSGSSTSKKAKVAVTDGPLKGEALARSLAAEHLEGWCLVVVAGMNYALAVESRGLDVLTTAEQLAKRQMPKLLSDLKQTVNAIR